AGGPTERRARAAGPRSSAGRAGLAPARRGGGSRARPWPRAPATPEGRPPPGGGSAQPPPGHALPARGADPASPDDPSLVLSTSHSCAPSRHAHTLHVHGSTCGAPICRLLPSLSWVSVVRRSLPRHGSDRAARGG